jgi:hypothetical protein
MVTILKTAMDSLEVALDAALAMTFPASDPVALFRPETGRGAIAAERAGPQPSPAQASFGK